MVLLVGAQPHDPLDPGPVVPTAVEQHDLPSGREVGDVALEVPLGLLPVARNGEGGDPAPAGVEVLGDALDHAAFARGVATLDDDDDPLALVADPLLHPHQLLLEPEEGLVVDAVSHGPILPRHQASDRSWASAPGAGVRSGSPKRRWPGLCAVPGEPRHPLGLRIRLPIHVGTEGPGAPPPPVAPWGVKHVVGG